MRAPLSGKYEVGVEGVECVMKEQMVKIIVSEKMSFTRQLSWINRQLSSEMMRLKFTGILEPRCGLEIPFFTKKNQGFLEK